MYKTAASQNRGCLIVRPRAFELYHVCDLSLKKATLMALGALQGVSRKIGTGLSALCDSEALDVSDREETTMEGPGAGAQRSP